MATVVLVHGIAQEQQSADTLEAEWLPHLAGGIRAAGFPKLADRLRSGTPTPLDVRMAFHGDLFLAPNAQGADDLGQASDAEADLAEDLARVWLRTAATHAPDPRDQSAAEQALANIERSPAHPQGARGALGRPAMNALARLRWFAPAGMLAGRLAWNALSQVTRYLTDEQIRSTAQQRVHELVDEDTRLVIGHSLGSVISYEALHRVTRPLSLITLGSPLALRSVIYDRLRPQPPSVPGCLTKWDNFADPDDLVAAHLDIASYFPANAYGVSPVTGPSLDNGARPHEASHYLTKKSVGLAVAAALDPTTLSQRHR